MRESAEWPTCCASLGQPSITGVLRLHRRARSRRRQRPLLVRAKSYFVWPTAPANSGPAAPRGCPWRGVVVAQTRQHRPVTRPVCAAAVIQKTRRRDIPMLTAGAGSFIIFPDRPGQSLGLEAHRGDAERAGLGMPRRSHPRTVSTSGAPLSQLTCTSMASPVVTSSTKRASCLPAKPASSSERLPSAASARRKTRRGYERARVKLSPSGRPS